MTPAPRRPDALLPITPVLFHALVSLADADRHGYAILKEIAERTHGAVVLSTGTLYGLIKRSLADGLIEPSRRKPAAEDDERRRYYRLTPFGRQVVAAEAERLQDMVTSARAKRLIRRSEG